MREDLIEAYRLSVAGGKPCGCGLYANRVQWEGTAAVLSHGVPGPDLLELVSGAETVADATAVLHFSL